LTSSLAITLLKEHIPSYTVVGNKVYVAYLR